MNARRQSRSVRLAIAVAALTAATATGQAAAAVDDAARVSQNAPQTLFCGQSKSVSVTMRNTGTSTWTAPLYALKAVNPQGTTRWGTSTVPVPASVAPGATVTFSFTVTAPATAGTYNFQWRMSNGVAYFGVATANRAVPVVCTSSNGYKVGYREVTGTTLDSLFNDGSHVVEDASFSSPLYSHVETSTVYFGGTYLMFHRTQNDNHSISLATSTNGTTWTAGNGGVPVLNGGVAHLSAPSVIVDRDASGFPRLSMVFEYCNQCQPPRTHIGKSYSYDGVTWTTPTYVVVSREQYETPDAGTPNLVRTPDNRYRIGYHATNGSIPDGNNGAISVAFADGATLDAEMTSKSGPVIGKNTAVNPGNWAAAGAGKRDIVKEGAYWYMVLEGLRGSVACIDQNIVSWGLLRTTDPTFRTGWQLSPRNPIRIDRRDRGCGEDMPSFQVVGGVPYILVTNQLQGGPNGTPANLPLQRYKIVPGGRGVTALPTVAMARTPDGLGYYEVTNGGNVYAYGNAQYHGGSLANTVGIAARNGGYWLVASNGDVIPYGSAQHHGEPSVLNFPIVGIAATPSGNGYWLVASDGGIFNYGDAPFHGSMGGQHLNAPVVGMAARNDGNGYWLVASDGGIFAFNAPFEGSMGGQQLNQPIVGMAVAPDDGYWLLGKDGGIFAFPLNEQQFLGSTGGRVAVTQGLGDSWAVGIVSTPASLGYGYWIVFNDGGVLDLGIAGFHGDPLYALN